MLAVLILKRLGILYRHSRLGATRWFWATRLARLGASANPAISVCGRPIDAVFAQKFALRFVRMNQGKKCASTTGTDPIGSRPRGPKFRDNFVTAAPSQTILALYDRQLQPTYPWGEGGGGGQRAWAWLSTSDGGRSHNWRSSSQEAPPPARAT
jgi:hypothetical protein